MLKKILCIDIKLSPKIIIKLHKQKLYNNM